MGRGNVFWRVFPCGYAESVFQIDYQKLYDKGYRGILFDVDNTLVHHGDEANEQVAALFDRLRSIGFRTVLLSNNDTARLAPFSSAVQSPFVPDAEKPSPKGYQQALELLAVSKREALCIGDQMFTDIRGANRCGIDSMLVHYIVVDEKAPIGVRRHMERVLLFFYQYARSRHKLDDVVIKE